MKSIAKFTFILGMAVVVTGCQNTQNPADNLYGYDFDTAHITYRISGTTEGTSEVFVQGEKKRIENNTTRKDPNGNEQKNRSLVIQDQGKIYRYDLEKNEGVVFENPLYDELKKMQPEQRKERLLKEMVTAGYEVPGQEATLQSIGTEVVAGQTCEVYKRGFQEVCLWNNIPLKTTSEVTMAGVKVVTLATKVELNSPISAETFHPPKDIPLQEIKPIM